MTAYEHVHQHNSQPFPQVEHLSHVSATAILGAIV